MPRILVTTSITCIADLTNFKITKEEEDCRSLEALSASIFAIELLPARARH